MATHTSLIAWLVFVSFLPLKNLLLLLLLYLLLLSTSFIGLRGSGEDGQLGIGNNEEKEWVCVVKALEPYKVRSVVAGSRNSLAICDDGKVLFSSSSILFSYLLIFIGASLLKFDRASCYFLNWVY